MAPTAQLTGSYVNVHWVDVTASIPPHVHHARFIRADGSVALEVKTDGKRIASDQGLLLPTSVDPGPPPFPYPDPSTGSTQYIRAPASYGVTLEVTWTENPNGTGNSVSKRTAITVDGPQPIIGYADLHAHIFSYLGFGGHPTKYPRGRYFVGKAFGDPAQALAACTKEHGIGGFGDLTQLVMSKVGGLPLALGHSVNGAPSFDGWPSWGSYTHQQLHENMLRRAHLHGLKLVVTHALNSEWMCSTLNKVTAADLAAAVAAAGIAHAGAVAAVVGTGHVLPGAPEAAAATAALAILGPKLVATLQKDPNCRDIDAVNYQIDEAFAMQNDIDARSGGPGNGWFRIVHTPAEARGVISQGKLAVVLGTEVDSLFGCDIGTACSEQYVRSMVKEYYDKGVRHFFPIHFYDNAFGGSANQNFLISQRITNPSPKRPCSEDGYKYDNEQCNARGLTPLGRALIGELRDRGMIIDVDHMSSRSFRETMDLLTPWRYPVVSGHTGFVEIASSDVTKNEGFRTPLDIAAILKVGGMFGVIAHQGHLADISVAPSIPGQTSIQHACGNSSETTAQAYLFASRQTGNGPVAIGSDLNGFASWPGPRYGNDGVCKDRSAPGYVPLPRLPYPFTLRATGVDIPVGRANLGTRLYDFNDDGLEHVGMLPDMLADFQAMGMTRADLDSMFFSAEGYIRLWERATYLANR